jgi:IS1 family transposase
LDRKKGQAIAFYIGDRSQKGAQKIWDNLTSFYKENNRFYIDDWDAYKTVFPTKK